MLVRYTPLDIVGKPYASLTIVAVDTVILVAHILPIWVFAWDATFCAPEEETWRRGEWTQTPRSSYLAALRQ